MIKWLDDGVKENVIIKATNDVSGDDDEVFFHGMSKAKCIEAMKNKEHCENEWQILEVY